MIPAQRAIARTRQGRTRGATVIATTVLALLLAVALIPAGAAAEDGQGQAGELLEVDLWFADQPAHARTGTLDAEGTPDATSTITSVAFDPTGAPVTVGLRIEVEPDELEELGDAYEHAFRTALKEADPSLATWRIDRAIARSKVHETLAEAIGEALRAEEYEVTLDLAGGSPTGTLTSGSAFVTDGGAVAAFAAPPPSVDAAGRAFRLEATVETAVPVVLDHLKVVLWRGWFEPALKVGVAELEQAPTLHQDGLQVDATTTSAAFNVFEHVTDCGDGPCEVSARGAGFDVSIDAAADSGVLALNLTEEQLCGETTYQGLPGGILVDSAAVDHDKHATFLIDKATVQAFPNNGRAHYDICMVSEAPFLGKGRQAAPAFDDTSGGDLAFGPALLENCNRLPAGHEDDPCIAARTGAAGGKARIVVRLPAEDPWMR